MFITIPSAQAERPDYAAYGAFALPGPDTPRCDNILTGIEKYTGRAVIYTGKFIGRKAVALADLVQGDPETLLNDINRTWSDITTGVTYVGSNTVLLPVHVVEQVFKATLPNSEVTYFISEGRKLEFAIISSLAKEPMNFFEGAVSEVSHDLWDVVENIDNPEAFGLAFSNKFQKWAPVGALSYIFTESDPLKGAEKAAERLYRQAEIFSAFVAPYAKAPSSLVNGSNKAARVFNKLKSLRVPGIPLPSVNTYGSGTYGLIKENVKKGLKQRAFDEAKAIMAKRNFPPRQRKAMVAALAVVDARLEEASVTGTHPFYIDTEIVQVPAQWMGDSYEDGGKRWGLWHPTVENGSDCISLGDFVMPDRGSKFAGLKINAVCGSSRRPKGVLMNAENTWWARPIDYDLVWGDNCSGGRHDRSIWAPVCPVGYSGVGFVGWYGSWKKPLPNRIACLKNDPQLMHFVNGATAGLTWMTDDKNSGAKYDVAIYSRTFAGMSLMHAVPRYPANASTYPASVQVAVSWGQPLGPGIRWTTPAGIFDQAADRRFWNRVNQRNAAMAAVQAKLDALAKLAPPTSPTLLTPANGQAVVVASNDVVAFKWENTDGATHDIYLGTTNNHLQRIGGGSANPNWLVAANTLAPGTYFWKVVASNIKGHAESPLFSFTLPAPGAIMQPGINTSRLPATSKYTDQIFINTDPVNTYYISTSNEFVQVDRQGRAATIGKMVASADSRFDVILQNNDGTWAGVDSNRNLWVENTPGGLLTHLGSAQDLTANRNQINAPASVGMLSLQPAVPNNTYTHQVFLKIDQKNGYYLTLDKQLVQVSPQGRVFSIGRVVASQNPDFEWAIQADDGDWAVIDNDNVLWQQNNKNGSWIHLGNIVDM